MKSVANLFHKAAAVFSPSQPPHSTPTDAAAQSKTPDRKDLPTDGGAPGTPPITTPITQRKASTPQAAQPVVDDQKSSAQASAPALVVGGQALLEWGWEFRKNCLRCGVGVLLEPESDAAGKPADPRQAYITEVATLVREMPQARQPQVAGRLIEVSRERLNLLVMSAYEGMPKEVDTLVLDQLYKNNNLGATLVGLCRGALDPVGLKAGLLSIQETLDTCKLHALTDYEKADFIRCMAGCVRQSLTGEAQARSLAYLRQASVATASDAGTPGVLARWNDPRVRSAALRAADLG